MTDQKRRSRPIKVTHTRDLYDDHAPRSLQSELQDALRGVGYNMRDGHKRLMSNRMTWRDSSEPSDQSSGLHSESSD